MTPEDIKALLDEQRTLWKQFREENDALLANGKNTQKEWTEKLQALNDRLDAIETTLNRPVLWAREASDERPTPAPSLKPYLLKWWQRPPDERQATRRAFETFLRTGLEGVTPEDRKFLVRDTVPGEAKALSSSAGVEFLASPEVVNEIIKGVVEFSPIRSIARVVTTSKKSKQIRKRTGTFAASWVAKTGTRTETTGLTYGMEEVPTHELYALVDVPFEDLEDSDFNLEAELNSEFAEQFGVAEGKAFVSGDAVGEPEGILTNAAVAVTVSGNASAITADGLIQLFVDLKDVYARNATWVLKRSTIGAIRKLKDAQNQYLWQPGLAGALPATILDRPYVEAVDMPAVAANAYPVVFGDFRRGYLVLDRIQISVLRDPFSQASTGAVRFHARKRVGGQVILAEAIRKLKIST